MRTTVTLDDDVAAAVERFKRERMVGVSEAVNQLIRSGLSGTRARKPFRQVSRPMHALVDMANVWRLIEMTESVEHEP
ncbi:MAG TPA: CopG family transcriptional regulator [Chloroflexota bacterium]|jgi:metal-responsive CopG/Arc/MetJ family transcriptional regulator|nr:CopG family transcriptional regulator [Chloroflexota bacterium]